MRFVAVAAIAMTVGFAACGSDEEAGSGGGAAAAATVEVSETDFKIDPANPRLARAGAVTFRVSNDGRAAHALEVEGPGVEAETQTIEPGRSATLRADLGKPGRYTWYCPVGDHRDRGMEGEITVGGAGRADDSGETTKEDDSGGGSYGY